MFFTPPAEESEGLLNNERTEERQDRYSTVGIERIIPLRFVHVSDNNPATPNATLENIQAAVDHANRAFRPAGVQFFTRTSDAFYMPNFKNTHVFCIDRPHKENCPEPDFIVPKYQWNQRFPEAHIPLNRTIGNDLNEVFPSVVDPGSSHKKNRTHWLVWASYLKDPSEIIVWVLNNNGAGGFSNGPVDTQFVVMQGSMMNPSPWFAHELGHFFGLPHSDSLGPHVLNPLTNATVVPADWWDMMVGDRVGGTGTFKLFSSRAEAASWTSSALFSIDTGSNCSTDASNKVSCTITSLANPSYQATYTYNSTALLERLSFITNNPDAPGATPPSYKYGSNAMSYTNIHLDRPASFSASQVQMIRNTLRYNVVGISSSEYPGLSGRRHLLGQYQNQATAFRFDVDGDGKRDLGVYEPPVLLGGTGRFRILLSSRNYSTNTVDSMTVQLGSIGDTPLVGDFDGDGRDDVAVWGRSSTSPTQSRWRWCLSPAVPAPSLQVPSCNQVVSKVVAMPPTDVPLAGHQFAMVSGTGYLTHYRPSSCTFLWEKAYGTGSGSVTMAGTCNRNHMPLPGLYDNDLLTDLATYDPAQATFKIIPSQNGYSTAQTISRNFSSIFIAGNNFSDYLRSGAVPITGMYRSYRNYSLGAHGPWTNRLAFALWQPSSGMTHVMWDPAYSSDIDYQCPLGGTGNTSLFPNQMGQVPLGSLGTNFAAPQSGTSGSQVAVYTPRKSNENLNDVVSIVTSPNFACSGDISTRQDVSIVNSNLRDLVVPVADIDGDGKADLLFYDPTSGIFSYLKSSNGFLGVYPLATLGEARAVLL